MQLPSEVPVMTLPNAILFPQALLPLYIFEPRYRQMLSDALDTHRMFSVAMRKPGPRNTPHTVAGLGLIRASVSNKDGTSYLILQGVARVELAESIRYKPYRVNRIRLLHTCGSRTSTVDALTEKVMELVKERLDQGFEVPVQVLKHLRKLGHLGSNKLAPMHSLKQVIEYLTELDDPDHLADLISCTLLPKATQRQAILEVTDLEERLSRLARFLAGEIKRNRAKE